MGRARAASRRQRMLLLPLLVAAAGRVRAWKMRETSGEGAIRPPARCRVVTARQMRCIVACTGEGKDLRKAISSSLSSAARVRPGEPGLVEEGTPEAHEAERPPMSREREPRRMGMSCGIDSIA